MFCPHLGEIALQISPLTTWPRLLPTNSLPQILEILSVRIEEEALTRAGLHEVSTSDSVLPGLALYILKR